MVLVVFAITSYAASWTALPSLLRAPDLAVCVSLSLTLDPCGRLCCFLTVLVLRRARLCDSFLLIGVIEMAVY